VSTMHRIVPFVAVSVLALLASSERSIAEITYPWCAQYSGGGDGAGAARNCGFWTNEQCSATVSGIGGYCEVNAMYQGPSPGMIPPPYQIRPRPPGATGAPAGPLVRRERGRKE
jgi:Protein of unknown function (DUF3551)